jgi:hypothetical protein
LGRPMNGEKGELRQLALEGFSERRKKIPTEPVVWRPLVQVLLVEPRLMGPRVVREIPFLVGVDFQVGVKQDLSD